MAILSINMNFTGMVGVSPRQVFIVTNNTFAEVTAAGFLNPSLKQGYVYYPNDIIWIAYGANSDTVKDFQAVANPSTGIITLNPITSGGEVILPTTVNHIATYVDANGTIGQDPAVALTTGGITATGDITALGNIVAGADGDLGRVVIFPSTASSGVLALQATANTGPTDVVITNAAMLQASTITIPDPAVANANFVVAPQPLVSGNIVKASGVDGLIIDAGFTLLAKTTAAYGGGGTSNTFTAPGVGFNSIVVASIATSTNQVSLTTVAPALNEFTASFSADPGAGTTLNYIAITPAV